ncbi:MAG TPA: hypothetical protein VGH73_18195 [Thermoanaerobaculia bacterium]
MKRWPPYALVLILAAAVFLAAVAVPYRVDTDTAFQLGSVLQWLHGTSPAPGMLRVPDPVDLSRDRLVWSTWWPPGFPLLYAPLAAVLPFSAALRATSFLLFLAGTAGWLRLMDRFEPRPPLRLRLLVALALFGYAATLGGAASLRSADLLAYAAGPWLAALALRLRERESPLFLGGIAFGASYWLRYSLFLAVLPLAVFAGWRLLRERRLLRLATLGSGFALPVAALFLLNLQLSENLKETATGARSTWAVDDPQAFHPTRVAISLAGAPGLGLFQTDLWATHLTYFSDAHLPFLRAFGNDDRLLFKSLLGIPGTALLAWALAHERRRRHGAQGDLAAIAVAGFYLVLAAVSLLVGYDYLAKETRFAACVLPLTYPFVLTAALTRERRVTALLTALLFGAPLVFATAELAKRDLRDRLPLRGSATDSGLLTPELSSRDVPAVRSAVAAALRSPRDLVVVAGPAGWGSSYVMGLDLPFRTLPVGTFPAPLGARYLDAGELRGKMPLRSSRPLRVVIVAARDLVRSGWLPRLESRFPQARPWRPAPVPAHSNVEIWCSDLEVP